MAEKPWKPSRRQQRVLLVLLSGASNLYGLTLMRASQTGSYTVYPLLDRLEDSKCVTGEYREQPGGKSRRVYALTPEGRKAALGFLKLED